MKRRTAMDMMDAAEGEARTLARKLIAAARYGGRTDSASIAAFGRTLARLATRSRNFTRKLSNIREIKRFSGEK